MIGKYQPPQFELQEARAKRRQYRGIREEYGSVRKQVAVSQAENFATLRATHEQSEKHTFTRRRSQSDVEQSQATAIARLKRLLAEQAEELAIVKTALF